MNAYLNYEPMVVQANTAPMIESVLAAARACPDRVLRVGSGELGDSLLLDPVFRLNEQIITGVADEANVRYEAKTKTSYVDHLLGIGRKGAAVIGFSLNPAHIAIEEEGLAAPVADRLAAATRCVDSGYQVSFHFDPIIATQRFPDDYLDLVEQLASFPSDSIAWISLGTIRFPPSLKDSVAHRPFAAAELVPSRDGKLRYLQPVRRDIYETLKRGLAEKVPAPVYMCMESLYMWNRVFGSHPQYVPELHGVFAESGEHPADTSVRWRSN
jgi:spore photoproduct lyase